MKKKNINCREIKLYNVLFPVWIILIFPVSWFIIIPGNFMIDSLVLLLVMHFLKIDNRKTFYKKHIILVVLFGFLSDMFGSLLLLLTQYMSESGNFYEYVSLPVTENPFDNIYSMLYTVLAITVSGVLIYVLNRFITFRKLNNRSHKRYFALSLAILTAPYLFLCPSSSFYGTEAESFTNHIVKSQYVQAEIYTEQNGEWVDISKIENVQPIYSVTNALRNGINTAEKTKNIPSAECIYEVVFYEVGNTQNKLEPIKLVLYEGDFYFEYDGKGYIFDKEDSEKVIIEVEKFFNANDEDSAIE